VDKWWENVDKFELSTMAIFGGLRRDGEVEIWRKRVR